jgi:hypothetical protein
VPASFNAARVDSTDVKITAILSFWSASVVDGRSGCPVEGARIFSMANDIWFRAPTTEAYGERPEEVIEKP